MTRRRSRSALVSHEARALLAIRSLRITKTRLIYGSTDQERTGGEKPTDSAGHC